MHRYEVVFLVHPDQSDQVADDQALLMNGTRRT